MQHLHLPQILFETTPSCNLDCRYCYNVWKPPGAEIPVHSHRPENHDALSRTVGSWQKATRSLRVLQDLGASPVAVIVSTRINLTDLETTLDWSNRLGVRQVAANRFNVGGSGIQEWKDLSLSRSVE